MGDKIKVGRYQIGNWNFSIEKKQLQSGEQQVDLTGGQTQILALLISQYPATLTSDYLLDNISDEHQVTKNKLYQGIAKLRKVFEDSAHKGQFIETVPKLGYRLTIAPLANNTHSVPSEQPLPLTTESTDIFADLSFIQSEASIDDSVVQPIAQPLKKSEQSIQSLVSSNSNQAKSQPTNSVTKPVFIVLAIIISVVFIVVQAIKTTPEVAVVSKFPERLFLAPVTYTFKEEVTIEQLQISSFDDLNENLRWWFNQQLQHLPIIKVITKNTAGYPRLLTHVTYHKDFLEVDQSYFAEPDSTAIILENFHLDYTDQFLTQRIDPRLLRHLVGYVTIDFGKDSCNFSQLTSNVQRDQVIDSSCLAQYHQRFHFLLDQIETRDAGIIIEKLDQLSTQLLKRFPVNSLGYQVKAKAALLLGDTEMSKLLYHSAIELNGSDADNFIQLASLYRDDGDYRQSVNLLDVAIVLESFNERLRYWQARDIQKLGYFNRAHQLSLQQPSMIKSVYDRLRFSHFNYNTLLEIAQNNDQMLTLDNDLIEIINASHEGLAPFDAGNTALKVIDYFGRVSDENIAQLDFEHLADRILYLPHYARLLIEDKQQEKADAILNSMVNYLLKQPKDHFNQSTLLAQTYALLGRQQQAIEELSRVISNGWMPDLRYDLANLRDDPNLSSLLGQWQFRVLVQLVDNRQSLLIKLTSSSETK